MRTFEGDDSFKAEALILLQRPTVHSLVAVDAVMNESDKTV